MSTDSTQPWRSWVWCQKVLTVIQMTKRWKNWWLPFQVPGDNLGFDPKYTLCYPPSPFCSWPSLYFQLWQWVGWTWGIADTKPMHPVHCIRAPSPRRIHVNDRSSLVDHGVEGILVISQHSKAVYFKQIQAACIFFKTQLQCQSTEYHILWWHWAAITRLQGKPHKYFTYTHWEEPVIHSVSWVTLTSLLLIPALLNNCNY